MAVDSLCVSETSLEPVSPVNAAPEVVCTSPGSSEFAAPELEVTTFTSRSSPVPRTPPTDTVSPGTVDSKSDWHRDSEGPSGQPESPQYSRPAVDGPEMVTSAVQTLAGSRFNIEEPPEPSPPPAVSTSPDWAAASDAFDVNRTGDTQSNATIFWTRCNQAGWTKEIFSELVSQLSSLEQRVQSQEASHQGENSLDSDWFCGKFQYKLRLIDRQHLWHTITSIKFNLFLLLKESKNLQVNKVIL